MVAPLELGDVADGFAEASLQAMTYDGNVYGVPYSIENVALVRNADMVAEAVETYDEVIARNLQVMDTAAFALCRDQNLPIRIYDMMQPGALMRILRGEPLGTLVHAG